MGKFKKALQKAEREKLDAPDRRSSLTRQPLKAQAPERPANTNVAPVDHQDPVPERKRPDMHTINRAVDAQPAAPLDPPPTTDPLAATMEPLTPSSERRHDERPGKEIASKAQQPTGDPQKPSSESNSDLSPDTGQAKRNPENKNIALIKSEISKPAALAQQENTYNTTIPPGAGSPASTRDLRVEYSRTKIQVNDPEDLRNNQIISGFDDSETTDQIKILRMQVLKKLNASGGNSILVTSANPYEGKTFTSINLGVSIAKEFDRTVLIIDADIRKPTQRHTAFATEFFSLNVDKGLSDYLKGGADISDVLINPGIDKLTLIPGGIPVENSPELLNSDRMEQMMLEIKSRYSSDRIVIVDGPAMLPFPDAMILSRYVDGVLPVIEAERTSTGELKKMMNLLRDANILGTVLNKNRG